MVDLCLSLSQYLNEASYIKDGTVGHDMQGPHMGAMMNAHRNRCPVGMQGG